MAEQPIDSASPDDGGGQSGETSGSTAMAPRKTIELGKNLFAKLVASCNSSTLPSRTPSRADTHFGGCTPPRTPEPTKKKAPAASALAPKLGVQVAGAKKDLARDDGLTKKDYERTRAKAAGKWLPSFNSIAPGFDTKMLTEDDWVGLVNHVWEALERDSAAVSRLLSNHLKVLAAPTKTTARKGGGGGGGGGRGAGRGAGKGAGKGKGVGKGAGSDVFTGLKKLPKINSSTGASKGAGSSLKTGKARK